MPEEKTTVRVNYSGNSHRDRDAKAEEPVKEQPKVEKIEGISATIRKKTVGRKIGEMFSGESMEKVGDHILFEVLIPAAKNMLFDAATQGLKMRLYGDGSRTPVSSSSSSKAYTPYNKMSSGASKSATEVRSELSRKARATHNFDEILFESRGDAEEVIESLRLVIEQYGTVKVADLYELVDLTGSFTDNKFGWDDLRDANVRLIRSGYILDLPRPMQVD